MKYLRTILLITLMLGATAHAVNKQVLDDTNMSLGARSLGMGRTYAATVGDGHSVFLNPASLGSLKNNSLTLSGSQMMDGDLYWFYGGGSFLLNPRTSLGLGVIYSNESGGNIRDNTNSSLGQSISLSDMTMLLAFGHRMSMPWFDCRPENLFVGARLKYITHSYQGLGQSSDGMNLDAGAIWETNSHLRVGAEVKDLLGTKLNTQGYSENFDTRTQLGVQWDIMEKDSLWDIAGHTLMLSLDSSYSSSTSWLWHGGAEWKVGQNLDLRAGYYQEMEYLLNSPTGVANNYFSFGLGYQLGVYHLNYAFQPQDSIRGMNHYVGVVVYEHEYAGVKLDVLEPKDKTFTFFEQVRFRGSLQPATCVRINGQMFRVSENRQFEALMPLNPGRNPFLVEACDDDANAIPDIKKELTVYRPLYRMQAAFDRPQDKTVTYDVRTTINGVIKPEFELQTTEFSQAEVQARSQKAFDEYRTARNLDFTKGLLRIDGRPVTMDSQGRFQSQRNLTLAKNKIETHYEYAPEKQDNYKDYRILRLKQFDDLAQKDPQRRMIEELGTLVLVTTANQKRFEPAYMLKRKELGSYLVSAYHSDLQNASKEPREYVKSVNDEKAFVEYMKQHRSDKTVVFYPDKKFRPNQISTRAEGISLFARFNEQLQPLPTQNYSATFEDLSKKHWVYPVVAKTQTQKLLVGYNIKEFVPRNALTKRDLAMLLLRTQLIKSKVADLYDWESY
jgi:opacity protein-like surface antigen